MQHAVETIAHAQGVLARFNVDIGSLHVDGARDQVVCEPDDGGFARQILQAAHVLVAGLPRTSLLLRSQGAGAAVDLLDGALDDAGGHQARFDGPAEQEPNRRNGIGVEGIGGGNDNGLTIFAERNQAVAGEKVELQMLGQQGHLGQVLGFRQRHAEELGQQPGQLDVRQQAEPGQDQIKALARLLLGALGAVHGQLIERVALDEKSRQRVNELLTARVRRANLRCSRLLGHSYPRGAITPGKNTTFSSILERGRKGAALGRVQGAGAGGKGRQRAVAGVERRCQRLRKP